MPLDFCIMLTYNGFVDSVGQGAISGKLNTIIAFPRLLRTCPRSEWGFQLTEKGRVNGNRTDDPTV